MNLGIKWLWKDVSKIKVDKLKKDVKANTASITNLENTKANKSYVDSQLSNKADTTTVNNQLNGKADTTTVNNIRTELANKVDTTYVNDQLNSKADTTYVNDQIGRKTQVYNTSTNNTIEQINYYKIPFQVVGNPFQYTSVATFAFHERVISVSLWWKKDDSKYECFDGGAGNSTYHLVVSQYNPNSGGTLKFWVNNADAVSGVNQYEAHILYAGDLTLINNKKVKK